MIWSGRIAGLVLALCLAGCADHKPAPVVYGTALPDRAPTPKARPEVAARAGTITVQKGNTLYSLARISGVPLRSLIAQNNLRPPYILKPGQVLVLPAPRTHKVARGETVYGISRLYGVDLSQLMRANTIRAPYTIKVGQTLRLPARHSAPAEIRMTAPKKTARPVVSQRTRQAAQARVPTPPKRAGKRFAWPVQGRIISSFGPKKGGLHNDGINIAVAPGTEIRAAENGIVVYAGNELKGYGHLLLIKHAGGWTSAYAHNSKLLAKRGQKVQRGQVIARAGTSGGVDQAQLHFELRKGADAVNPVKFLSDPRQASRRPARPGPG